MLDEIFAKKPKKKIKDLNIVPILDMLVTVIFFLLLSTSFTEYTKLTVPPATTQAQEAAVPTPPLAPKLLLAGDRASPWLLLVWGGEKPGERSERITECDPSARRKQILEAAGKLMGEFSTTYPAEKSIQLGLGPDLPYQDLISVMDGTRGKAGSDTESTPLDIVLISHAEAQARVLATVGKRAGG